MTLQEAVEARHSVRAYTDRPLSDEFIGVLNNKIAELNDESGLHIQLVCNEPKAFSGIIAKYGKFRCVQNYIVMAGVKSDTLDEQIGYYGELLVLTAQTLGLNTCWVGLSYTKVPGTYILNEGEIIRAYIAIGYGETQGVGHKVKSVSQVSNASDQTPTWFRRGVESALLAPTAVNQQKFFFEYVDGAVRAHRKMSLIGFTQIDLGIVKCHFEVGAGTQNFEWA